MNNVLLLNGSHSEFTLLNELKGLDKRVIVTGNVSDAYCNKYADEYIKADYSDMEHILEIAKENQITGIVSCANDFGIITAGYIAEKMGLPGYDSFEVTKLLHQKDLFKQFALKNGLRVPNGNVFTSVDDATKSEREYPLIVKPVDLTGGKGVSIVYNDKEYLNAVDKAFAISRKKVIVTEKFIEGTYHSFSTFLVDRRVVAYFSDNEYSNVYRFFVDTSAGPADSVDAVKDILISQVEIIAEKLNLANGVFHIQYVMDKDKNPYIMDITRRCSGDVYPEPVERATGIPWSKWIVMSELGFDSSKFTERGKQSKFTGRHCIMADREGTVKDVVIDDALEKYVYKSIIWWQTGYVVHNYQTEKLGVLFYEFDDKSIMDSIVKNIKNYVRVNLM